MSPRSFTFSNALGALLAAVAVIPTATAGSHPFDPAAYQPTDTSALLGSPDPLPPLEIEPAFPGLQFVRPVAITSARDGSDRLFVCDQEGVAYVFANDPAVTEAKVFLDLRGKARRKHFEEGLLGLAFHPHPAENGQVFVYYSVDPQASLVSRFRLRTGDPNSVDPASEEVLLRIPQPFGNHNGGSLEFGPDGMLYIGLGDGGDRDDPSGNGQNLETLLGSILRIDIDRKDEGLAYAIPPDNPFVGALGGKARGEIWAHGIRNPWRMSFDRLTGDLWVGDVGQDLFEEIDIIVRGGNYGWNLREGLHPFRGGAAPEGLQLIDPVWEYPREDGKSITGGVVYRGARFPELYGTYLFADFVTFNIWGLRHAGKEATSSHLIARSALPVTAFGEDEAGEVYLSAFGAPPGVDLRKLETGKVFSLNQGSLYRLRRRSGDAVDTAAFPRRLSETKLFTDLVTLTPTPGLIPYSVNVPLWSDGAAKERFIALPEGGKIQFREGGAWELPVGATLVKTFTLPAGGDRPDHRLETRLLVRTGRGWAGYTYLWNDERTDARLLDTALAREYAVGQGPQARKRPWYFPSRSDCSACHTQTAGHVLGLSLRQMNREHDYGTWRGNQLEVLHRLGVLEGLPAKPPRELEAFPAWGSNAPVERLARAYLDTHCAICHAPGGTGLSRADLRSLTPIEEALLLGVEPGQGRLGGRSSRLIDPGRPATSELLLRMMASGAGRMPTLATSQVDWEAVRVVGQWIESMSAR